MVAVQSVAHRVPPLYFAASQYKRFTPVEVKRSIILTKVMIIGLSILTAGLYALGLWIKSKTLCAFFMPSTYFGVKKRHLAALSQKDLKIKDAAQKLTIKTLDGVKLDGRQLEINPQSKKWMIVMEGNGCWYEDTLSERVQLAKDLGVNLLVFNYRGVNESGGNLFYARDLFADGAAAIEYLRSQNKEIILYGHSQGGGVAAKLAAHYPVKVMSDRSYTSTAAVAKGMRFCGIPLHGFIHWFGFQINALKSWKKIPANRKFIVFHKNDEMIKYTKSSLFYAVHKKTGKNPGNHFELKMTQNAHCYDIKEDKAYLLFLEKAKQWIAA